MLTELQLRYFIEAVNQGSFSSAAKSLYVSQSSISRQIYSLEQDLGMTLFKRCSAGVELTIAGQLFFDLFLEFSSRMKETINTAAKCQAQLSGTLVIGIHDGWDLTDLIVQIQQAYHAKWPNVKLIFESYSVIGLREKLRSGSLSVALTVDQEAYNLPQCGFVNVMADRALLFFSDKHPCAQRPDAAVTDFSQDTLYVLGEAETSSVEGYQRQLLSVYGFSPNVEIRPNVDSILSAISTGRGYAIFGGVMRAKELRHVLCIDLLFQYNIICAYRQNCDNPLVQMFIDEISFLSEKRRKLL